MAAASSRDDVSYSLHRSSVDTTFRERRDMSLDSKEMAETPRGRRCDSVMSMDEDDDKQEGLDGAAAMLSQSFGSLTELSSLYSMSEDDFDRVASRRVQEMLDNVDAVLYDPPLSRCEQTQLTCECNDWTSAFPHIRVIGHQMAPQTDEGFQLYPAPAVYQMSSARRSLDELAVSGKQLPALTVTLPTSRSSRSSTPTATDLSYLEEEIIEQNGSVEEIFAIDNISLAADDDKRHRQLSDNRIERGFPPVTPDACERDSILSALFDDLMSKILPCMMPIAIKAFQAQGGVLSSGVQVDELEGDRSSWKEHALWLMEPPSFHDGIHASMLSPLSPVVSPISQSHSDKSDIVAPMYRSGSASTSLPLSSVLTVRSKALSVRERTYLTQDTLPEESEFQLEAYEAGVRPPSVMTEYQLMAPTPQSASNVSNRRRASIASRPGKTAMPERTKTSILEEDRRRKPNLADIAVLRGHKLSANALLDSRTSSTVPVSLTPASHSVSPTTETSTSHAVTLPRFLLPPISHKRDISSANINRTMPSYRAIPPGREFRLLPGRDRERSLILDNRPNTTHTVYRADHLFSSTRRPMAIGSRQAINAFEGVVLRQGPHDHEELNVKGSSIPPPTESSTDDVVTARNTAVDLHRHARFDDMSVNWAGTSGVKLPSRRRAPLVR